MKRTVLFSCLIALVLCLMPAIGGSSAMSVDGVFDVRAYGAVGDGTSDDTAAIQAVIDILPAAGAVLYFPPGTYRCQIDLTQTNGAYPILQGSGTNATRLMAVDANAPAVTFSGDGDWEWPHVIRDLSFVGDGRRYDGLLIDEAAILGLYLENVAFYECRTGFRNTGGLWYTFVNCSFSRNHVGVWIEPETSGTMHGGCGRFTACNWYLNYGAGVYVRGQQAGGSAKVQQIYFDGGINEGNKGPAFIFKNTHSSWPLVIRNVYFELNGTDRNITVDNTLYSDPCDIHLDNVPQLLLKETRLTDATGAVAIVDVNNSSVRTEDCYYKPENWRFHERGNSSVTHVRPWLYGANGVVPGDEIVVGGCYSHDDAFTRITFATPIVTEFEYERSNLWPNGSMQVPFAFVSDGGQDARFVSGGDAPIFGGYLSLTLDAAQDPHRGISLFSASYTVGKHYVWSFDVKSDTNDATVCFDSPTNRVVFSNDVDVSSTEWRRFYGFSMATVTGVATMHVFNPGTTRETYYLANMQLVEFEDKYAALAFIRDGKYVWPTQFPRSYYVDTAYTTDYAIVPATDNGKRFTNDGALHVITIHIGPASVGQTFSFTRMASYAFRIDPEDTDCFRGHAAGKYLELDSDGDSATVECLTPGVWDIVAAYDPNGIDAPFDWEP